MPVQLDRPLSADKVTPMVDVLAKAEAFATKYAPTIPLRFTESELRVLCAHLQVAYSTGYRDASNDCAAIVKEMAK